MNRPRKSLHPFPLVIQDCWFAARNLASVSPTVRRVRGLAPGSGSLIFARTLSFLSAAAFESRTFRGPNSLSLRLFFIDGPCDCLVGRMHPSAWRTVCREDRLRKPRRISRAPLHSEGVASSAGVLPRIETKSVCGLVGIPARRNPMQEAHRRGTIAMPAA